MLTDKYIQKIGNMVRQCGEVPGGNPDTGAEPRYHNPPKSGRSVTVEIEQYSDARTGDLLLGTPEDAAKNRDLAERLKKDIPK